MPFQEHFDEYCARNRVEYVLIFLSKDEVIVEKGEDATKVKTELVSWQFIIINLRPGRKDSNGNI